MSAALHARSAGTSRLESRTGKDLSTTYPEIRDAVGAQHSRDLLLDGEVVAYDGDQTSFTRLQQRLGVCGAVSGAGGQVPGRLLRL